MSADPTTVLLPSVVAPRAPAPREARVKVLQMGPALDVRGGISSVEQLICDYLPPYASIRHVATMTEGAKLARATVFARAIFALSRTLEGIDPTIVHIHFASRGSTLRKMILANMVLRARRPLILHAHGAGFDQFHRGLPAAGTQPREPHAAAGQRADRAVESVARFLRAGMRGVAVAGGGAAESGARARAGCRSRRKDAGPVPAPRPSRQAQRRL